MLCGIYTKRAIAIPKTYICYDIMIYNAINTIDLLNEACIRYTSVMSDTLGITYGTMCIVLYILIPLLWTAMLICSSRLLIISGCSIRNGAKYEDRKHRLGRILFYVGLGIIGATILFLRRYFLLCSTEVVRSDTNINIFSNSPLQITSEIND